jgi:hypothetical protein
MVHPNEAAGERKPSLLRREASEFLFLATGLTHLSEVRTGNCAKGTKPCFWYEKDLVFTTDAEAT